MRKTIFGLVAALSVTPAFALYSIDDGVSESSVGVTGGDFDFLWTNSFVVTAGDEMITEIQVVIGTPLAPTGIASGYPFQVGIWNDADLNGVPDQSGLIGSLVAASSATPNVDLYEVVDIPDVTFSVGAGFCVGVIARNTAAATTWYPAGFDTSAPTLSGRSYAAFAGGGTIDPNNIAGVPSTQRGFIEGFGLVGNWMVRATSGPVPEPGTFLAIGAGIAGLAIARRRRK